MGALQILLTATAQRRADNMHFKAASKRSHAIAMQAKRDMLAQLRASQRADRWAAAASELPAGTAARLVHRTSQVATLTKTVAEILVATVAIRAAVQQLRSPEPPTAE